jgi:hypothetical protein
MSEFKYGSPLPFKIFHMTGCDLLPIPKFPIRSNEADKLCEELTRVERALQLTHVFDKEHKQN